MFFDPWLFRNSLSDSELHPRTLLSPNKLLYDAARTGGGSIIHPTPDQFNPTKPSWFLRLRYIGAATYIDEEASLASRRGLFFLPFFLFQPSTLHHISNKLSQRAGSI